MKQAVSIAEANLRPMLEDDLDVVFAIETMTYEYPWTRGIFADCLRVGYSSWVMLRHEEIIGYGILNIVAGESHILNLCIHPQARGNGLGKTLLNHLLQLSKDHHTDVTFLEVRPSNQTAITLYENMGFNEVGMRKNYYPAAGNRREDALILARHHIIEDFSDD